MSTIHFITKSLRIQYECDSQITTHTSIQESGIVEYLAKKETTLIGLDTETEGFDPYTNKLLLLQLGDFETQYVIDCTTITVNEYKEIFNLELIFLIHNAAFDLRFLYHQGIYNINVICTYLAESVLNVGKLNPKGYKGLDQVTYRYCKATLSKEERGLIHKLGHTHERIIQYAAKDVVYLESIWLRQKEKLEQKDLLKYFKLENSFVKVLAYMTYNGIGFNATYWKELAKADRIQLDKCETALNNFILNSKGFDKWVDKQLDLFTSGFKTRINWSSDKQVLELMEHIGINCNYIKKGEKKKGIGVNVLTPQKDKHPLIPLFLDYQKYSKAVSTFGDSYLRFINSATKRIHTTYNQIQNTTRMSCGKEDKKNPKNSTPNLQQIPSGDRRKAFVPKKGNVLTAIDYDGQEDIIFANKCLDQNLLDFYDKKLGDGHSYVAKLCFPKELDTVKLEDVKKERPDLRQKAKSANFAIKFGGVGFTISNNLSISPEEGEAIYKAYMDAFPGIKKYFDKVFKEADDKGYVLISKVSGAKSYFDFWDEYLDLKQQVEIKGFWDDYRYHKQNNSEKFINQLSPLVKKYFKYKGIIQRRSYNYPVQGEAANITKLAAIYFYNWILGNNLWGTVLITHVVHDEILIEYPKEMQDRIEPVLKMYLEKAGKVFCKRVPLTATPATGKYWIH